MKRKGFTLVETIIAVIIVAVIASFAILGYSDAVQKHTEQQIIMGLKTMYTGIRIRETSQGTYNKCNPSCDIAAINSDLGLSIVEPNKVTYQCVWDAGSAENRCRGDYVDGATTWTVEVRPVSVGVDPYCSSGNNCPSCTAAGCDFL